MTFAKLFDLTGRTALVTGGAGHLGRTFTETLLEQGARVALMDISENVHAVANGFDHTGEKVRSFKVDLELEETLRASFLEVISWSGGLDILVNNAAFVGTSALTGWNEPFEKQTTGTFRRCLEVNLTAVFTLCQLAAPHLKKSGHGSIINIASIYAIVGPDNRIYEGTSMNNASAYGASKAGVVQFTSWLATSLAPDIRANVITPGGVARGQPASFVEQYNYRTPLGRMAKEEDFCGAIAYFASDASAYVTGHNLIVDGGWCVW